MEALEAKNSILEKPSKGIKILVANKFYWHKGGAETVFFNTAALLEAKGHTTIPFSMKSDRNLTTTYSEYFVDEVDYTAVGGLKDKLKLAGRIVYNRQARLNIDRLIEKEQPDIAHMHNIHHQISPSVLYALRSHWIPTVMTLHDYKLMCPAYAFLTEGKVCEKCRGHRYYNAVLNRCSKGSLIGSSVSCAETYLHRLAGAYTNNVDRFIAPSRFLKTKMEQYGYDGRKIAYLPNFISVERYKPVYGGERKFVYVGRLSGEKGLYTLLEAVAGTDIQLEIIGDGPERQGVSERIEREKLENVSMKGYLAEEALSDAVSQALAVVVPSECYENCPMAVLEAFALGKPVIGAKIGGIPELIEEGRDGLLFEPRNEVELREAMLRLLGDPLHAKEMGKRSREKVELRFGPERYYEQLIGIYESIL